MLTIVAGFLGALIFGTTAAAFGLDGWIWTPLFSIAGFLASTIPINLWVKKRLEAVFKKAQSRIEEHQQVVRRRLNTMQNKMMSSTKGVQRQLEKQQEQVVREAIDDLKGVEPLRKWNLLAARQANTMRAQLYFQIKDFGKADEYFENCLALDPVTIAMRLTRLYKREEMEKFDKLYRKSIKRFKGEKGVLLYALRSWILVKQKKVDEAIALLDKAKDDTESDVLRANWQHLVNGRNRQFSNAGLGDSWYALHLETPKPVRVKQRRGARR